MPRLNYQLKHYSKAVEIIAEKNGLSHVNIVNKGGSIVRFELFEYDNREPMAVWVIHHDHKGRKKEIWSKDDYKKAAVNLNCTFEDFIKTITSL